MAIKYIELEFHAQVPTTGTENVRTRTWHAIPCHGRCMHQGTVIAAAPVDRPRRADRSVSVSASHLIVIREGEPTLIVIWRRFICRSQIPRISAIVKLVFLCP